MSTNADRPNIDTYVSTDDRETAPMSTTVTADVLAEFVDTFSAWDLASDVATTLNCGELDALTALLRAAGAGDAADTWTKYHAMADDEGDAHYSAEGADDE